MKLHADAQPDLRRRSKRWPVSAFWTNVTFIPDTGCWVWLGVTDRNPYGSASVEGVPFVGQPHRSAFFLTHGYAPAGGRVVAHGCDVPGCINPANLEDITHSQNLTDAASRLRLFRGRATPHGRMWSGAEPFGAACRLAKYMRRERLSTTRMAEMLGVAGCTVHQVLSGKRRPGLGFVVTLERLTDGEIPLRSWVESKGKRAHTRNLARTKQ